MGGNKRKRRDMELALMSGDMSSLNDTQTTSLSASNPDFDYNAYNEMQAPPSGTESSTSINVYDPKTGEVVSTRQVSKLNGSKGQINKLAANAAKLEGMIQQGLIGKGTSGNTKKATNAKYGW